MSKLLNIIGSCRGQILLDQVNRNQQGVDIHSTLLFQNYEEWIDLIDDLEPHIKQMVENAVKDDYDWTSRIVSAGRRNYITRIFELYGGIKNEEDR